jgi:hypothetical protein
LKTSYEKSCGCSKIESQLLFNYTTFLRRSLRRFAPHDDILDGATFLRISLRRFAPHDDILEGLHFSGDHYVASLLMMTALMGQFNSYCHPEAGAFFRRRP